MAERTAWTFCCAGPTNGLCPPTTTPPLAVRAQLVYTTWEQPATPTRSLQCPPRPFRHPPFPRLASAVRSWLAALPAAIAVVLCLHPFLSSFASFTRGPSPVRLRRLPFLFSLLPLAFTLPPFVASLRPFVVSLSNHKHLPHGPCRAMPPTRPAAVIPANAGIHSSGLNALHTRPKMHPAAPQEFFGKNS